MGFRKEKRPTLAMRDVVFSTGSTLQDAGGAETVQALTLSGVSGLGTTSVSNRGLTFITSTGSGAGWQIPIAAPGRKGVTKRIFVNINSSVPVQVHTASSSKPFWGSTLNSVTFTTAGSAIASGVTLVSQSSLVWAVASIYPVATTATTYITSTAATA